MFGRTMILAVLSVLLFGAGGMAQTTAKMSGVITDNTGAVLPGAQVVVTNAETGIARTLTADERGRFVAAQLPPGPYQVAATMSGFETLIRRGITLAVGQEADLNFEM